MVLAAGKGERLRSGKAKVLHELNGWPMLRYVLAATTTLPAKERVVVIGHQGERVREEFQGFGVTFVEQREQRGTGHALLQTEPVLRDRGGELLILPGDLPLLQPAVLEKFLEFHRDANGKFSLLSAVVPDPRGYGRVVRDSEGGSGRVLRIVEERDATPEEREIKEINSGIYLIRNDELLWEGLRGLRADNAQGEYYLTDLVEFYIAEGEPVRALALIGAEAEAVLGVNSRAELAQAEAVLRRRKLEEFFTAGVSVELPEATVIEQEASAGQDTLLRGSARLRGRTRLGKGCLAEDSLLRDVQLGDEAVIRRAQLERYTVGPRCRIEFSLLRGPEPEAEGKEGT